MKYIKEFYDCPYDIDTNPPEVGDYVISNFSDDNKDWSEYIDGLIGQFISTPFQTYNQTYRVKYFISDIDFDKYKDYVNIIVQNDKYYIIMIYSLHDLRYWSKDKEELELLLMSKKYNL